jgi:sulfopyruvate decarboxylase TPP-binding subunit
MMTLSSVHEPVDPYRAKRPTEARSKAPAPGFAAPWKAMALHGSMRSPYTRGVHQGRAEIRQGAPAMSEAAGNSWQNRLYEKLRANGIDLFVYVPDAGHKTTINRAKDDAAVTAVAVTNEAEGVPILAGYHLGGRKGVLLMQSNGVGNCVNQFSLVEIGRFPFLTFIAMRGEFGEQNQWQFPMGKGVEPSLTAMGLHALRVATEDDLLPTAQAAHDMAFHGKQGVGVMLSQRLIGTKAF